MIGLIPAAGVGKRMRFIEEIYVAVNYRKEDLRK